MTVLTSESTFLGTTTGRLPRVNLIPPEIAAQRAFRRVQFGLGAAVLATMGVVAGLYVLAAHGVSSAQSEVEAAQADQVTLTKQITAYGGVTALYAAAEAAQAQLTVAMGEEVRYSQLLNDLSLSIPSNVWLSNVTFDQSAPKVAPGQVAPAVPGAPTPIGSVTFNGVAFSHNDVATWLETLAGLKTYQNPYFSSSAEGLIGTRPVVNFASTVTMVSSAKSGRYTKPVGG